jgi:alpha-1,2-mannosyltransferase
MLFRRLFVATAIVLAVTWFLVFQASYRIDLDVYRIGVDVWRGGGDLYGPLPETLVGVSLPFIYPPIAAVVLTPLAILPFSVASTVLTLISIALVAVVLMVVMESLGRPRSWALAALPLALFIEPIRNTMAYGQVNIVLMALVVADCLVKKPRWPRGMLIGIAAAIKLTPLAFLLFFLIRRDYKSAVTAMTSFVATTLVGVLVAPAESVDFWTDAVFHTSEKVGIGYVANQSILGVLTRLTGSGGVVWLALAAAVLALAILGMRNATPVLAMSVNALAMLLVSPISWSHHWVWCLPILLGVFFGGRRALAGVGLVVFVVSPHWWFPDGNWDLWHQVLGGAYFLYAMAVMTTVAQPTREKRAAADRYRTDQEQWPQSAGQAAASPSEAH